MELQELRAVYYALADDIRLKILKLLYDYNELCVCQLQPVLNISQPNLSFHLRILRDSNLVNLKKEGKWSYYSLNKENEILKANLDFIKNLKIQENLDLNACQIEFKK
ncbi:metalloregulator ArsR/SmtB family transcription factor [Venenivibrio stagnispumantis]|uniref:Transcriptional regulator, ArsR family n=1 Tax=Venenivibrio stagnispumantis TaxID=407998 RepID=A0AA45WPY1_9AQUI|nr:metalloregulator ArsR/SmtB family transcription factor [Venenivibrio stagnispumantis]MCW4572676.1 metalloregulator ArsR/SmtB family transcription factor [Venenivibrio stagnispumantis]SMP21487.1 transcriptional regulator, ArsR family [Venenivibrio stagnispumantis]